MKVPVALTIIEILVVALFSVLLFQMVNKIEKQEIVLQEYVSVNSKYALVHPENTNDLYEVFVKEPTKWSICKNGLDNCKEINLNDLH